MSENVCVIRPKADRDVENQAYYYAREGSPELGYGFLLAVYEASSLLATQPNMGWRPRLKHPGLKSMRLFRVRGFERTLVLYIPLAKGVEILRVVDASRNLEALLKAGRIRVGE